MKLFVSRKYDSEKILRLNNTLNSMTGKRAICIAMFELTNENAYNEIRLVIEHAMKALKNFLKAAISVFKTKRQADNKFDVYLAAKQRYDIIVLLLALQMCPSQRDVIVAEVAKIENFMKATGTAKEHQPQVQDVLEEQEQQPQEQAQDVLEEHEQQPLDQQQPHEEVRDFANHTYVNVPFIL